MVGWSGWEFLDWIISGGESGIGAKPSHPDYLRAARDFCQANGIAYLLKQEKTGCYALLGYMKKCPRKVVADELKGRGYHVG
jgi:protein gp37